MSLAPRFRHSTVARRGPSSRFLSQNWAGWIGRGQDPVVESGRRPDDRGQPRRRPGLADLAGDPDRRCGDVPDHGIDAIAVAAGVVEPLQDEADRRIRAGGIGAPELPAREGRPIVAGEVDRADDRRVELAATEPVDGDGRGLHPRGLVAGDREAGAADAERPRDPAGHHAAQRAHRPVRREGRPGRLAQLIDPAGRARPGGGPVPDPGSIAGPCPPATSAGRSWSCSGRARSRSGRPCARPGARPTRHRWIASAATRSISDCWGSISASSLGGMRNWPIGNSSERMRRSSGRPSGPEDQSSESLAAFQRPELGGDADDGDRRGLAGSPRGASTADVGDDRPAGTHSSISTWALMPPKPNPLMAARRGRPECRAGHGSARVRTRNGLSSSPSCGLDRSKFAVGGRVRCFSAIRTLSRPAAPAAVSAWPMFALTEPITHWPARQPASPQSALRLATSTASPRGVPVAWHSIRSTSSGRQPACS